MKKIYILSANGSYDWCDGTHVIICKKAFSTKEDAENYIPTFRLKCITPLHDGDLKCLEDNWRLNITISEHDLVEKCD